MIRSKRLACVQRQRLFAAGGGADLISFLLQVELQRPGEVQLVFDQENPEAFHLHRFHAAFSGIYLSGCGSQVFPRREAPVFRDRGRRTLNVEPRPMPGLEAQTFPR